MTPSSRRCRGADLGQHRRTSKTVHLDTPGHPASLRWAFPQPSPRKAEAARKRQGVTPLREMRVRAQAAASTVAPAEVGSRETVAAQASAAEERRQERAR